MENAFKKLRKETEAFEKKAHQMSHHFASALFPFPPKEFIENNSVELKPLIPVQELAESQATPTVQESVEAEVRPSEEHPTEELLTEELLTEELLTEEPPNEEIVLSKAEVFDFINEGSIAIPEEAPEKGVEIPLVCLGLLREDSDNEQNIIVNDSFTKMVSAMKFDESLVKKQESLRYYSQDSEEVTDFFRNIFINGTKVLLAFGAADIRIVLNKREKLSRIHGKFLKKTIKFNDKTHEFYIVPVFHPEYLLANQGMKKLAWADLQGVMSFFENN